MGRHEKFYATMFLDEAMLVADLRDNLLYVRAVDRRGGAVVFVGGSCYILNYGEAVLASGVFRNGSVIGSANESDKRVLNVTQSRYRPEPPSRAWTARQSCGTAGSTTGASRTSSGLLRWSKGC